MKTLILSSADVYTLVRQVGVDFLMSKLIDRLDRAFATFDPAVTEIPERTGFYYRQPATGLIEWMPLFQRSGRVLMKMVGYHPENPTGRDLPTILSTFSMYDTDTGHLASLVDGTFLTALRTGAASAVASRLLARGDSHVLGLIGCGAQAVTQLHALSRVFEIRDVLIHDQDPAVANSFRHRLAGLFENEPTVRCRPADEIIQESDIVSVATAVEVGEGPVFAETDCRPWLHINAVGSDLPGKTELPRGLLHRSFICADNPEQAFREGECQQLQGDQPVVGLDQVARKAERFAEVRGQLSVFDSTGWALEDLVAMDLITELAAARQIGTRVSIESVPTDPWNPYEFLSTPAVNEEDEQQVESVPSLDFS